ncbi:hypothetical protein [Aquincola tertiaricarbonis]|uniref:hypothetical protein n=1 Tax=Aquincola tertiaricarbonis TaxID=391953 RepID=UPI000614D97B|nr:hypothetical protein [Aquincola tertiaricarbonis]
MRFPFARFPVSAHLAAKADSLAHSLVNKLASLAAKIISTRCVLAYEELDDEECEELGLPYDSTRTDAIFVDLNKSLGGSVNRLRVDVWMDPQDGCPEGSFNFDLFGYGARIHYLRPGLTPADLTAWQQGGYKAGVGHA